MRVSTVQRFTLTSILLNATFSSTLLQNPTSYHGRPLVPIAPGAKVPLSPVSIMPAGSQVRHVRPPPPYDVNGRPSFVHPMPANTVVTSATQSRMVTPVNFRMMSPGTPTAVGSDPSTPTFGTKNLTTVLVVTKPHSVNQASPGIFAFRGGVSGHGLRLPLSPRSHKSHMNNIRPKASDTIKIHGPMIHQLPGAMNPTSSEYRNAGGFPSSPKTVKSYHKMQQAVHIPSGSLQNKQSNRGGGGFDKDSKMMMDYNRYRDLDTLVSNQTRHFVNIKPASEIKLEPQDHHHYQGSSSSPSIYNHGGPTVHIHHPASSAVHPMSPDEYQVNPNQIGLITHIPDRDGCDFSNHSNMTSPSKGDYSSMNRYEAASHQNRHSHAQSHHTHMSAVGSNQPPQNHLTVVTTAIGGTQSAVSPLHSPPPLRPAPASQHRSIALRSPPNLTPSTVLSHFDFPPVATTSVISQPAQLYHQHSNQGAKSNGHAIALSNPSATTSSLAATTQVTVTLTYIPVKTQSNDKIIYVPVNQNMNKDRQQQQQPVLVYTKQRNPSHHFPARHHDNNLRPPNEQPPNDLKLPVSPRDEHPHSPFSGVTRKFTVRTLQRDATSGAMPSGLTSLRIQGSNVTEGGSHKQQPFQTGGFAVANGYNMDRNNFTKQVNIVPKEHPERGKENSLQGNSNNMSSFLPSGNNHNNDDMEEDDFENIANQGYDEISDYDNDEYYDETGETSPSYDADNPNNDQKMYGYLRGRKRGRNKFFVRRKGASTHQYKYKYKQALEQARVMREQRPSFLPENLHHDLSENSVKELSLHTSDGGNAAFNDCERFDSKAAAEKDGCSSLNSNGLNHTNIENASKDHGNVHDNGGFVRNNNGVADVGGDTTRPSPVDAGPGHGKTGSKIKLEENGLKRKTNRNSTFENDFFYGQWMISQDGQQKRKRKNSTSKFKLDCF